MTNLFVPQTRRINSSLQNPPPMRAHRFFPKTNTASRAALYAATLFLVLTINFFLPRVMPGDPLLALQDPSNPVFIYDPQVRANVLAYYGLDKPLLEQYFIYLQNIFTGQWGWSIALNAPVNELIRTHLPWTLLLMVTSTLLASLIALWLGTQSGWARGSKTDKGLLAAFLTLQNVPAFFIGVVLLAIFGLRLKWFPLAGARTPFETYDALGTVLDIARHLFLPLVTLTLALIGSRYLLMRNSMLTVLGMDFVNVARAKGLPERDIKYRHAMRNAILPFFTVFALQMGGAVAGSVLIETLFAYPGIGSMLFSAVSVRDYPVMEGAFLVLTLAMLLANFLADVFYARLDPRVA